MQVVITPTAMCPKSAEWYSMQITKGCPDKSLKIKIAIRIDKPQNMKHAGSVCVADQRLRHNFKSGGYKYYCEGSEQNIFGGCTPTYAILGVQQLQRAAYGEPIGQCCYNILLVVLVH